MCNINHPSPHIGEFTGSGSNQPFSCPLAFYFPSIIQKQTAEEQKSFVQSFLDKNSESHHLGFSFETWFQWEDTNRPFQFDSPSANGSEFTILQIDSLFSFSILATLENGVLSHRFVFRIFSINNQPPGNFLVFF